MWQKLIYEGAIEKPTKKLNPKKVVHHVVLLIGFGSKAVKNFWIIKNNWGKQWGDGGYAKIAWPSSLMGKSEASMYLVDDTGYPVT
jgi:C1A family cysteine protease